MHGPPLFGAASVSITSCFGGVTVHERIDAVIPRMASVSRLQRLLRLRGASEILVVHRYCLVGTFLFPTRPKQWHLPAKYPRTYLNSHKPPTSPEGKQMRNWPTYCDPTRNPPKFRTSNVSAGAAAFSSRDDVTTMPFRTQTYTSQGSVRSL